MTSPVTVRLYEFLHLTSNVKVHCDNLARFSESNDTCEPLHGYLRNAIRRLTLYETP